MRYFKFFVQGFTRALAQSAQKKMWYSAHDRWFFAHFSALSWYGVNVIQKLVSTEKDSVPLGYWTDEDDHLERTINDSGHGESRARLPRPWHLLRGGRGVPQIRKRTARGGARCERGARPKLFGAAGRESVRAMRSAKVVDPSPWFGSGGTGDLDTNRGPPIPTPNAKKLIRVRTYVRTCTRQELSLSRALLAMRETAIGSPSGGSFKFFAFFLVEREEWKFDSRIDD